MKTEEGKSMEKKAEERYPTHIGNWFGTSLKFDRHKDAKDAFIEGAKWQAAQQEGWIDVKDRLPEKSTSEKLNKVMIVCKPLGVSTGYFWGEQHIGSLTMGWDITGVTHWMPLPAPPLSKT